MGTLNVQWGLTVVDNSVQTEIIPLESISATVDGPFVRRSVTLSPDQYTTLDAGEITPKYWFFRNIHDTADLTIGWGNQDVITLSPGDPPCWIRSSETPYAKGATAASRLLYAVYS